MEKIVSIIERAQRIANERGGDYGALTLEELAGFLSELDEATAAFQTPAVAVPSQ